MIQPSPHYADMIDDLEWSLDFAKVREFEQQAYRFGNAVISGVMPRAAAIEILMDAAESRGLLKERSERCIRQIIAEGLNHWGMQNPSARQGRCHP
jgi:hypothetical protein